MGEMDTPTRRPWSSAAVEGVGLDCESTEGCKLLIRRRHELIYRTTRQMARTTPQWVERRMRREIDMARTTSDQLLERLHEWGVRRTYGYPVDGINGLMGAFGRLGD